MEKINNTGITCIGIGGAGCNILRQFSNKDCGFNCIMCDTSELALGFHEDNVDKIMLGKSVTMGASAGNNRKIGEKAALESETIIKEVLSLNTKVLIIVTGLGGGTGTGASPVIARFAKELNIFTIAVVCLPMKSEGCKRHNQAQAGKVLLYQITDSLFEIKMDSLKSIFGNLPVNEAFERIDAVISSLVKLLDVNAIWLF